MSAARAYAETTSVSVEKSRAELDTLLGKHGAQQRGIMTDEVANSAVIMFALDGQKYSIRVPLPPIASIEPEKGHEPRQWQYWDHAIRDLWRQKEHAQACRTRWRAIILLIRAKLEAIRVGLSSPEREFLADLILPNGKTAAEEIRKVLDAGDAPRALGSGGAIYVEKGGAR